MKMMFYVFLAILSLQVGSPSHSAAYVDDRAQNYLMKFGYLPQSNPETGNLRTEDQLKDAIRDLQRYGGIPATGDVDDATMNLMSKRRCGMPDKPDWRHGRIRRHKRFTIHGQPWSYRNLTWSLRTEKPSGLETGGVRRELKRALELWSKNSKLTFQEVNSDRADILVYFHKGYHGDGYPFDGPGQILAHAFFPGSERGGDAHFDEEEDWLLQSQSDEGTSLFAVAAHEFGHSLGLAHSSVRGALMYPWYQGLTDNYELPEDDRHGIQQIYGSPEGRLWGNVPKGPSFRPSTTTTTTTTTTPRTRTSTTERPWRTRPPRPHHPEHRPRRPDYYPTRPDYDNPHKHYPSAPTNPSTTSTTTTTTTTTMRPWSYTTPYTRRTTTTARTKPTFRSTHRTRHHWTSPKKVIPDKCDTDYDAISMIRTEVFVFKGRFLWRIGNHGVYNGYPAEINRLFQFPHEIDHVDAVYERPHDKKIVFFIGRKFYVFDANILEPGYPRPLTDLGLPRTLDKIDGATVWGHNGKTFFFSGPEYWRLDDNTDRVELDYPRSIAALFSGVEPNIDAVFQWNKTTYFFKGKRYWEFDDLRMKVSHRKPKLSAPFWMGCPPGLDTNEVDLDIPDKSNPDNSSVKINSSSISLILAASILCFIGQRTMAWNT